MQHPHPRPPTNPAQVADHLQVVQLLNTFGATIDARDWDGYRALFDDPVAFDYSSIGGPAGSLSPDEVAEGARHDLGGFDHTQHAVTNHVVALDGDRATCEAHVRAVHVIRPHEDALVTSGDPLFENGGHYRAGLVRRDGGWKIREWTFTQLWSRGNGGLFEVARSRQA